VNDEPIADVPPPPAQVLNGMPVLPLRDVVVYPHMVIPLFVGREKSIVALDLAMKADKRILLVAQKQADVDDPKAEDLYRVGTVATILQLLKLPDGTVKVLVEGVDRASIEKLVEGEFFSAEVTALPDVERYEEREMDVLTRSVITQFEQYVKLNKKVPPEILTSLAGIEQAGRLADTVAAPRNREFWKSPTCANASSTCSPSSKAKWTCCRSRSAFAGASNSRWKRASASTT
jgi:ATP-dependent Lon protease